MAEQTLMFKKSIIIRNDINQPDNQSHIIIDMYDVTDILIRGMLFRDFYNKFSKQISELMLKTLPQYNSPVRYSLAINDNPYFNTNKTVRILSDMEIFFNHTTGLTTNSVNQKLTQATETAGFTNYDFVYEDMYDDMYTDKDVKIDIKLIITRERLPYPKNLAWINEDKTFKEEKCMICFDKEPNVLFCNCGHICICSDCKTSLYNENKCVHCNVSNNLIRIL